MHAVACLLAGGRQALAFLPFLSSLSCVSFIGDVVGTFGILISLFIVEIACGYCLVVGGRRIHIGVWWVVCVFFCWLMSSFLGV